MVGNSAVVDHEVDEMEIVALEVNADIENETVFILRGASSRISHWGD